MYKFEIICDSSSDLPENLKNKYDIITVPFYISFDSNNYYKENMDISVTEFYEKLKSINNLPKTSTPSVYDYENIFRKYLEADKDILCICLTSKFSGSYQSALTAANILKDEYKDKKIFILDSFQATAGEGLIVLEAAKMRESGLCIEEVYKNTDTLKKSSFLVCTVDSLEYLQKGGRIGKVSSITGNLLNIKPIISLEEGELLPYTKVRGRKKALNELVNIIINFTKNDTDNFEYAVLKADCYEDSEYIKALLIQNNINVTLPVFDVGSTITAHIGPSAIGICCVKKFK